MQSASHTNECKALCRKLLIFYYHPIFPDSLNRRSVQGKPTIANYISETLRRSVLFSIQRHKRVLLEITGEVMMSRVQPTVKNAAFQQKESEERRKYLRFCIRQS